MRRVVLLQLLIAATCAGADPKARAGDFDYYVLALSWSPQYCSSPAGSRDAAQCGGGRRYELVVHGLWPQYERGYPANCLSGEQVTRAVVDRMLDIMPSPRLVRHEWDKHGTCSGKTPAQYFAAVRAAYAGVRVPKALASPREALRIAPARLRAEFAEANPGWDPRAVTVQCGGGRFLSEVRVCLGKDLTTRACGAEVQRQQCRAPEVIVQPVR